MPRAEQRPSLASVDATLRRIDVVLAEPDPQQLADARWLVAANPSLSKPVDPMLLARYAGGYVIDTPAVIVTVPPTDTRPKWIGRLRRLLFGEPPQ